MPEPENAIPPQPPRRKWRRRVGWALLLSATLLIIFHRPLLYLALHSAGIRIAARQNIQLSFDIEGSVFTEVTLKNLHALPVGHSPVDSIDIEQVQIHYDFIRLLRSGIREFITGYRLRNAKLVISPFHGTQRQKEELANILRDILQQPALFSDHVQVENFNLTINTPDGPFILGGAHALLDPITPGYIRAEELTIPRIASWHKVHTAATYIDRHLIMRDFNLGRDLHAVRLELDGSQQAKGISYLSFEGTVLGGNVGLFLWRREIDKNTTDGQLTASVRNLSLKTLHDFLHWKPDVSGEVVRSWIQLSGNPNIPSKWEGNSSVQVENANVTGIRIDHAIANVVITQGKALMQHGELSTAGNHLAVRVERQLPESTPELFASGLEATFTLDAPELAKLHPGISTGALRGDGRCRIRDKEFTLVLNPTVSEVAGTLGGLRFALQSGSGQFRSTYDIHRRPRGTPWFDGFHANAEVNTTALRLGLFALDTGVVVAHLQDGKLGVDSAEFHRASNTVRFDGQYALPMPPQVVPAWSNAVFDLHCQINAPTLAAMNATADPTGLKGALTASGEFHRSGGETSGHGNIDATDLVFQQFSAKHLAVDVPIDHNSAHGATFQLDLNGKDHLTGQGSLDLHAPYGYEGRLSGNVRDLAIFQPLIATTLAGSLDIDWHGSGELQLVHHSGEGRVALRNGRLADFTGINGEMAGVYSPESIELSTFQIRSDQGAVRAGVKLQDQRLRVDQLRLEIGKIAVLSGTFGLPVDLRTPTRPETIFPKTGALEGRLTLEQLDLSKAIPAQSPPPHAVKSGTGRNQEPSLTGLNVRGQVTGAIIAAGTLGNPEVTVSIQGRDLQAMAAKQLPPCTANIALTLRQDRLGINGAIAQPGISPLQFTGVMPFVLSKVIAERRIDPATPIALSVKLPPSPATLLAQVVPEIRYAEGQISVDASARGTLGKPVLDGGVTLDLPAIRFQNSDLPGIGSFRGDLRFSGNELTFRRFQGDVAGGPFAVSGRVNLEHVTDPQLDLRFRSQGTLLARNDSLTLRADSDLKIAGPLNTAQVTGKVGITKSRFFREIEILPIGLPGRPAPKQAPWQSSISIDAPPFRGWNFDVAITTSEPLVVRGNLANGLAYADLHLGGNGLAPTLEGTARIENFVASLPFSRLTVDYGYLYFPASDPFNPTLDIHGTSRIRDYSINVYIYGTASEPQTLFTSEPPMAQEEVVALLATGATSEEFTQNNQVLASRAGVLLLQDLYHKIFKRRSAPSTAKTNEPFNRFSLDVGTVDPRTGRQEVNGRFKLSDQYEIGAGVDVQGDVQVQLRYLLRFR